MAAKHITINQVAQDAGVSIQTVSRVINNRYDVSAETRQRVQEAIDRLGYKPNEIARGLASKRSRTLGLVTYDFNDFFFTQVVTGAEEEAHKYNYFFMLGSTSCSGSDMPKYLRLLNERHVDGVLFAREGSPEEQEQIERLAKEGTPIVIVGYHDQEKAFNAVDINNFDGGMKATDSLLEHGHRRIACITGPMITQSALDRLAGYRSALERAGIPYDPTLVVEGSYGTASHGAGYHAMKKLLAANSNFTAAFVQNDRMAVGAISALREAGYEIPRDFSIVGYDDTPDAEFSSPSLTTIRQPEVEIGVQAVRLLMRAIENPELPPEQIILDTRLIWRESVTQPRSA
jgi:LacI family transcriptional regulator